MVDDLEHDASGLFGTMFSCIAASWSLDLLPRMRFAMHETGLEGDIMNEIAIL